MIELTLPEPPSANRWWRKLRNRMVLSDAARAYKKEVGVRCLLLRIRPMTGPVTIHLDWYRGRKAGDLDKRLGIALDALQGHAYMDDKQIVGLSAGRYEDKINPRIHVRVEAA